MTDQHTSLTLIAVLLLGASAQAQQSIGTVSTADASVGGVLETSGATATIVNNGTITAHDHTASVTLARGGRVQVCSTSVVHLSQSVATKGGPLMVALDRGALELAFAADSGDAVLTPDMRMQPSAPGPLDLRIRVVSNGDTCVENRGSNAPALMINDTFGESSYIVHAGQRVLFEHGSLKQVVDSESSPCGCPAPVVSLADAGVTGIHSAKPGSNVEAHPFPEAVSQGLAPSPMPVGQPAGQTHLQVDMSLAYNGTKDPATQRADAAALADANSAAALGALASAASGTAQMATPAEAPAPVVKAEAPPPPPPDLAHVFTRFYRWLFRKNK